MMKRRITEEYVDDSCKAIEEKLRREVRIHSFRSFSDLFSFFTLFNKGSGNNNNKYS